MHTTNAQLKEKAQLKDLRSLLSIVVKNTHRVNTGKPVDDRQEGNALRKTLTHMLGRVPTDEEIKECTI